MEINFKPTMEQIENAMMDLNNTGFCINCGDDGTLAEPGARNYRCENCGKKTVFGFEELLLMGIVD